MMAPRAVKVCRQSITSRTTNQRDVEEKWL